MLFVERAVEFAVLRILFFLGEDIYVRFGLSMTGKERQKDEEYPLYVLVVRLLHLMS